jgi:hypothetical protein
MIKKYLLLIFLLAVALLSRGQQMILVQYKGNEQQIISNLTSIGKIKIELNDAYNTSDTYKIAWSLATLSQIYAISNQDEIAKEFQKKALTALRQLSPKVLCYCIDEINVMPTSIYNIKQLNIKLLFNIMIIYNDLALRTLPFLKTDGIDEKAVNLLTNNAAYAWKLDFNIAIKYFEKLKVVCRAIIMRSLYLVDEDDLKITKDPLRRYLRFMYNTYIANKALCVTNNCLEKGWQVSQFIKSRKFKSDLLKKKTMSLSKQDSLSVMSHVSNLTSYLHSSNYFNKLIQNDYAVDTFVEKSVALLREKIPELDYVLDENTSLKQIRKLLLPNEVYLSITYTDNERGVYAWRITNTESKLIKLDGSSINFFLRTEYFKSKIVTQDYLKILYGKDTIRFPLVEYARKFHKLKLDHTSNNIYLFETIVKRVDLKKGSKLIFEVDQNLAGVPLGLLQNPVTQKFLLEDFLISYVPSASIFKHLRNQKKGSQKYSNSYIGFSYLEDADKLFNSIISSAASIFRSSSKILHQAKETDILESDEISKSKIIHFVCHNDNVNKDFRLEFNKDVANDGKLTGSEIVNYLNNNSLLTILSSCQIAPYQDDYTFIWIDSNNIINEGCVCSIGETFSNLAGAFFAAGTQNIVLTQWPIDVSAPMVLFNQMLFEFIEAGNKINEALQLTQRKFIGKYAAEFWGGYILLSD